MDFEVKIVDNAKQFHGRMGMTEERFHRLCKMYQALRERAHDTPEILAEMSRVAMTANELAAIAYIVGMDHGMNTIKHKVVERILGGL
jgi:hypothetical protein